MNHCYKFESGTYIPQRHPILHDFGRERTEEEQTIFLEKLPTKKKEEQAHGFRNSQNRFIACGSQTDTDSKLDPKTTSIYPGSNVNLYELLIELHTHRAHHYEKP